MNALGKPKIDFLSNFSFSLFQQLEFLIYGFTHFLIEVDFRVQDEWLLSMDKIRNKWIWATGYQPYHVHCQWQGGKKLDSINGTNQASILDGMCILGFIG